MRLHDIKSNPKSRHRRKRLGCGESSGHGKTSGKGHKGQKARSGGSIRLGFEGGQMPIYRRLPKRGFNNNAFKKDIFAFNIEQLEALPESVTTISVDVLREYGLIKGQDRFIDGVKVLSKGDATRAWTLNVSHISAAAKEKIEKAGGSVNLNPLKIIRGLTDKKGKLSKKAPKAKVKAA